VDASPVDHARTRLAGLYGQTIPCQHVTMVEGDTMGTSGARATELSDAELRVIELVARGETHKSVARQLGLSVSTVSFHLANARRRLGVENNVALVAMMILLGQAVPGSWPPEFLG
jgi:DNA-binding CsgD family transcriptional regulator